MLFEKIKENFKKYKNSDCFIIKDNFYKYSDFESRIQTILYLFNKNKIKNGDIVVIYTDDHIDTYASILATFFIGAVFVPINSLHPVERNNLILKQLNPKIILSAEKEFENTIITNQLTKKTEKIDINYIDDNIAYILFTSGSTGIPKGVKLTYNNIDSFIIDFCNSINYLTNNDKFLQIYDLTFDASIHCYLLPLFVGGSIYTVSPEKLKYLQAYKIMEKYKITFAKCPPSVLSYLKPYFNKIKLPNLRFSLLGGEGFHKDLAKEWKKCIPNAELKNVYGPTEATINTHIYDINIDFLENKSHNGILSIGKTFGKNKAIIIDENESILEKNKIGELCLGGNQICEGYLNNEKKNSEVFFIKKIDELDVRFYKTGDLAYIDEDGDFIFCGRKDNQVQIQGYRVELAEIENIALKFGNALNYAAIFKEIKDGSYELYLFAENYKSEVEKIFEFLRNNLPHYMIPTKFISLDKFPTTSSGKISKSELKKMMDNGQF